MVDYIDQHRQEFGVEPICEVLAVAPSTYYAAKTRPISARAMSDEILGQALCEIHAANFSVYGTRKMWKAMRRAGHDVGRDQVARLMRCQGLYGVRRAKKVRTTKRDDSAPRPPDLVERNFTASAPNELYQGSHEPLVSEEIFAKVQSMLESKALAGERTRKHEHYLKGTLACGRCGQRMIYSKNTGRHGGVYEYFACLGRHSKLNACDLPYVWISEIEDHIERYYRTIKLDVDITTTLYGHLMKAAKRRTEKARQMVDDQRRRILALETERRSLLKAHLAGAVPIDLLQEEQNRISTELANAGALMANAEVHWEYLEKNLDRALAFASNLGDAYAMASPQVRRNLNQSMFEEIAIEVDGSIVHAPMHQPFAAFHDEGFRGWIMDGAKTNPSPLPDRGSNEALLVEVRGFEPLTPCMPCKCSAS